MALLTIQVPSISTGGPCPCSSVIHHSCTNTYNTIKMHTTWHMTQWELITVTRPKCRRSRPPDPERGCSVRGAGSRGVRPRPRINLPRSSAINLIMMTFIRRGKARAAVINTSNNWPRRPGLARHTGRWSRWPSGPAWRVWGALGHTGYLFHKYFPRTLLTATVPVRCQCKMADRTAALFSLPIT